MAQSQSSEVFSVRGRRIVIVGGTSGIGEAVAEYLAAAGAEVMSHLTADLNDPPANQR